MKHQFRDHYSHNFEFDFDNKKIATDRLSRLLLFFSFVFGLMFFILGSYFVNITKFSDSSGFEKFISKSNIAPHAFISSDVFGISLTILGVAIVLVCFFFIQRYKTITIKDDIVTLTDHPFLGKPNSFSEPLDQYTGVRLRLKFCQYDLFSRNKFIIELYHPDPTKIVPLYISTSHKHIRMMLKKYALHFNLPPIFVTDKGMVCKAVRDIERPYAEVVKSWNLPQNFLVNKTHSSDFICKKKGGKKMLKMSHTVYDLYSTLNLTVIVLFGLLLIYALFSFHAITRFLPLGFVLAFYVFLLTSIIYAYLTLSVRDIVLISNQKLVIFKKILGMTFQDAVVDFESLQGIDIFFTPTTGRYCLNLITQKQIIKIFNKLSPDDLRWIKCFIISEIIQQ